MGNGSKFYKTLAEETYENMAPEEPVLLDIVITDENGDELEPNPEATDAEELIETIESPEVVLVELEVIQLNPNFNETDAKEVLESTESPEEDFDRPESLEEVFVELEDTIESSSVEINTSLD